MTMSAFRVRRRLDDVLQEQLSYFSAAGYLTIQRPPRRPRLSPEKKRFLARQKRIDEAVDAILAEVKLLEQTYSFCTGDYSEPAPVIMSLRDGVNFSLEETADQFLADGRRGDGRYTDPRDWLTREQLALRRQKEVYVTAGLPDSRLVSGIYRRSHNPNAGCRPRRAANSGED